MKLLILTAVLLILGTVEPTPAMNTYKMDEDIVVDSDNMVIAEDIDDMVSEEDMDDMNSDKDMDMEQPGNQYLFDQTNKELTSQQDGGEDNDVVNEGVNEEIEQILQAEEFEADIDEADSQDNEAVAQGRMVYQGSTIALQTYELPQWLGCNHGHHCGRASCPKMIFTHEDYHRCWGEVFQIYRQSGKGNVKSGDVVGIYYPREKKWIGCAGHICGKASCPGRPCLQYGFERQCNWQNCWGEVFRIFKRGHGIGAPIYRGDKVAFYYVRGRQWLSQGTGLTVKKNCLGTSLPPNLNTYDHCAHETFIIEVR